MHGVGVKGRALPRLGAWAGKGHKGKQQGRDRVSAPGKVTKALEVPLSQDFLHLCRHSAGRWVLAPEP